MKRALITGIVGQDGSYLAENLINKGYEVHGVVRRVAIEDPKHALWRLYHIKDQITLHIASIDSYPAIYRLIKTIKPDECYHLAASSFVSYFSDDEFSTLNTNINSTHFLLASIKEEWPACKYYFAGSSEMYGKADQTPQNEATSFNPRSFYGISKLAGYHITKNYRELYGIFASAGILYNHESPRRGLEFVTRKITNTVAKIKLGLEKEIRVGNIDARRDWGYAPDYVDAMWRMLQQDEPHDFVIATGITHSVQELLQISFEIAGLNWKEYVVQEESLFRPSEIIELRGDASKAKKLLGWEPSLSFEELISNMVNADLNFVKSGLR